jgi:hypothetical protein
VTDKRSRHGRHLSPDEVAELQALFPHMTPTEAATKFGCNPRTAYRQFARWKRSLGEIPDLHRVIRGYSPEHDMTREVPEPYIVRGVSTYYNRDGEPTGQWVKSVLRDDAATAVIREFTEWLAETGAKGLAPLSEPPAYTDDDLMAAYILGDLHLGLYACAEETGEDFDIRKAEHVVCRGIDRLVASAPAAGKGLLLNIGDFMHADDSRNETPANHHRLDVDTRYHKVAQVGLRALVHCVRRLLEKHAEVDVWMVPGNHDPHISYMLALALDAFFESDPRVAVDLSPSLYRYMRFGKSLIGAHHGHGAKPNQLPLVMAADRPEDWGQTRHRYWWCGHIHHSAKIRDEHGGVIVEAVRAISPKDAWAAGKGYRAGRDLSVVTYHREWGEIQRTRCDVAML